MQQPQKGLISRLYPHISKASLEEIGVPPSRRRWDQDVVTIKRKSSRILEMSPLVSLALSQKMSHLFLLYKAYYTPQRLFLFGRRFDASCPRCGEMEGDLIYMFRRCLKLFRYWKEVSGIINQVFGKPPNPDVRLCVLGFVEGEENPGCTQIAILW